MPRAPGASRVGMATMSDESEWYGKEIFNTRQVIADNEDTASFWNKALSEDPSSYWYSELGAAAVERRDEPELDGAIWFYGGVGG